MLGLGCGDRKVATFMVLNRDRYLIGISYHRLLAQTRPYRPLALLLCARGNRVYCKTVVVRVELPLTSSIQTTGMLLLACSWIFGVQKATIG